MSVLTTVMYHYVRPIRGSRFPGIKGLELTLFREQLSYLERRYRFVSMRECLEASRSRERWRHPAAMLTFDDGFRDHYEHVFPVLLEAGIPGAFFPPTLPLADKVVLDVHKIHFILAGGAGIDELVHALLELVEERRAEHGLAPARQLYERALQPGRYDSAEVNAFKRLLQRDLPEGLREELVAALFARFVSADEEAFAEELYLSEAQIKSMSERGMEIGSHGHRHFWLDRADADAQRADIERSVELLRRLGVLPEDWAMCYPYGGYNDTTLQIVRSLGCALGVTTAVDLAELSEANLLELPRLDTNDLPKDGGADDDEWTLRAQALAATA